MPRRKVSTTVYFTPEQTEALRRLSDRTRVSVAMYIREGVDAVLARHGASTADSEPIIANGG